MFTDPQSVTVNAVAKSMPRQGSPSPETRGVFSTADGAFTLEIRQNRTAARFRREARLTQKKVAADPLTAENQEVSTSVMLVVDEPRWGFDDTELGYLTAAIIAWFDATNKSKLLGNEL